MSVLNQIVQAKEFEDVPPPAEVAGLAWRWIPPARYADGYEDAFLGEAGVVLTTKRFRMREKCRERHRGIGRVVFLYHLDGQRTVFTSTGDEHHLQRPMFVAYFQPKGVDIISQWNLGQSETAVCLGFDPCALPRIMADSSDQLSVLKNLLDHPGDEFRWVELALSSEMERVARSIVFAQIGQRFVHHFNSAKSDELLCVTLDNIVLRNHAKFDFALSMGDRLDRIKNLLDCDLHSKISIRKIAEEYSISHRRLNNDFEERYSINIQDYRTMVRLSKSVQLLVSTKKPLKIIAHEVGYDHASNFCIAFKKHYGHTPKDVRRDRFLDDGED
ncbi:AraC family transcriptional regulator [Mesorhizobium sp. L2C084A000]|uniref:helix-turn-helix domain-containing protein n=1 Tax=Mesorhizobium sp. L2C084A000 TaxID=1287116 RepID=UPI0018C9CB22|nr:AraC family transcriptional regulator [Mesorhizobium sp. L2C084A000]